MSDDTEPIDDSITPLISMLTFGGRIFGRAMSRITVEGAIEEIPHDGPLILAANHASNLDAVVNAIRDSEARRAAETEPSGASA